MTKEKRKKIKVSMEDVQENLKTIVSKNPEPTTALVPVYNGGFEVAAPSGGVPALREARRITDKHFNVLWKYYYEPQKQVQLTDFEDEFRRRLSNAWDLLTGKVLNDRKAVLAHTQWCKDNFMQITERTAYNDICRAKMLFGDPRVNTPVFEKARMSNIILELIEVAKRNGDLENAGRLIRRYNAVNGLEDDLKTNVPRPPITIVFSSDEETLLKQAAELMKGAAVDTDYEDVTE
jgi:RNAse (barnase) inhibitor barstar